MRKFLILLSLLALALPVQAQNVGETWVIKNRALLIDSIVGNRTCYTVEISEATPSTVGRPYCQKTTDFLRDYKLYVSAPQDTVVVPPQDTVVVPVPPQDTTAPPTDTVPDQPTPVLLKYYGGNNQTAAAGTEVQQSISVVVVDSTGTGVDGDTILWQVTSGGGSLNKTFGVTVSEGGKTGWSGARWTLGQSGVQAATATHKKTGQAMTFSATLAGAPPPPQDTTQPPTPPPPPPVDSVLRIYSQSDFSVANMGPYYNSALPVGADCNFNGVAGQCSSSSWIQNGKYRILYERMNPVFSIDQNRSFESPDPLVQHGHYIYAAATFRFNSISAAQRAKIDSAYTYWMGTTWKDSIGNKIVAAITDAQHEDALQKLKYFARQLGPNGGGLNHAVLNFHVRTLKFTPAVKYDSVLKQCSDTGAQVINIMQVPAGQFLDRDWRIGTLIKRSSGPMMPDGELTVWVNGQQYGPYRNICTNRDSIIKGFGRVSFGQQFQFRGIYSQYRDLDDAVTANYRIGN